MLFDSLRVLSKAYQGRAMMLRCSDLSYQPKPNTILIIFMSFILSIVSQPLRRVMAAIRGRCADLRGLIKLVSPPPKFLELLRLAGSDS